MSRLIATSPTWSTVPLRLALGSIMFAHGAQKVFGAWGGGGLSAWMSGSAPFNLQPSWAWLAAAAFAELLGGVLIIFGLLTRIGAFLAACVLTVALVGVHWRNGFFINQGGYEYVLALLAIAISLMITGGGNLSTDSYLKKKS
ncbi:MAG: DoxX family protein [Acidobacteria bacterium]|nr:DoxX family protein [Acidobacteriota bacterium]